MRFLSFTSRLLAAASLSGLLAACAPLVPPLAEAPLGDAGFKARMARTYPPGTPAAALAADLARDGFLLQPGPDGRPNAAIHRPPNLPCFSETRVDWTEDRRGRIVRLTAQRNDCT